MTDAQRLLNMVEADPSDYDKGLLKAIGIQAPDDWDLTNKHGIADANSCGQGMDKRHCDNPFLDVINRHGYSYSHTTPVHHRRPYDPGEDVVNHHTYKHSSLGPDYNVSAFQHPQHGWKWDVSHRAGLTSKQGLSPEELDKFLKAYLYRARKRKSV